jgi:hypothetical protein
VGRLGAGGGGRAVADTGGRGVAAAAVDTGGGDRQGRFGSGLLGRLGVVDENRLEARVGQPCLESCGRVSGDHGCVGSGERGDGGCEAWVWVGIRGKGLSVWRRGGHLGTRERGAVASPAITAALGRGASRARICVCACTGGDEERS